MSEDEIDVADTRLADWLGATFSGNNKHYESSEGWNPDGLAGYVRDTLATEIEKRFGSVSEDNVDIIYCASSLFVKDIYTMLERHSATGGNFQGAALSPPALKLVNWWSRLFTGAPFEMLVRP